MPPDQVIDLARLHAQIIGGLTGGHVFGYGHGKQGYLSAGAVPAHGDTWQRFVRKTNNAYGAEYAMENPLAGCVAAGKRGLRGDTDTCRSLRMAVHPLKFVDIMR